jgi:hypothetical protein
MYIICYQVSYHQLVWLDWYNNGPNVLPKSLLTFMTGVSLVSFVSNHVTTTAMDKHIAGNTNQHAKVIS